MTPPLRVSKQIQAELGHLGLRWKQPLIFTESSDDGRKQGWELMRSTPLLQCRISFLEARMLQNQLNLLKFCSDEDSTASVADLFQHLSISVIRVLLLTVKDFRKLGQLKPIIPGSQQTEKKISLSLINIFLLFKDCFPLISSELGNPKFVRFFPREARFSRSLVNFDVLFWTFCCLHLHEANLNKALQKRS